MDETTKILVELYAGICKARARTESYEHEVAGIVDALVEATKRLTALRLGVEPQDIRDADPYALGENVVRLKDRTKISVPRPK